MPNPSELERQSPILSLRWRPGGAQGLRPDMEAGDDFLVAVRACDARDRSRAWWEFAVITATEYGFEIDGSPWGWSWEDVEWYVPTRELI